MGRTARSRYRIFLCSSAITLARADHPVTCLFQSVLSVLISGKVWFLIRGKACLYDLDAGADPGGRISGSPERTALRVMKNTAAVQVGNRSSPGTSSATKLGSRAQC